MRWIILIISLLFLYDAAFSQSDVSMEKFITSLDTDNIDENSFEILINDLSDLYTSPVNLNTATSDDLKRLLFLSDFQILSLLEYRDSVGPIYTVHELQYVFGFDRETIDKLQAFIVLQKPDIQKRTYSKQRIILRTQRVIENQRGYISTEGNEIKYLGSPWKSYANYKFERAKLSTGFTLEKDAGEKFITKSNTPNYIDYQSFYISLNHLKFVDQIIIGDYRVNFGQGLVNWIGFSAGKSSNAMGVKKYSQIIRPYTSSNEFNFFRGCAATINAGNFRITPYISHKLRDARIYNDTVSQFVYFETFDETGLHNTQNQIDKQNNVEETNLGASIEFRHRNLMLQGNIAQYKYSVQRYLSNPRAYQVNIPNGKWGVNYSFYSDVKLKNTNLYSEIAFDKNTNRAVVIGINRQLNELIQTSLLYRNYSRNYFSPYSAGFGENSSTNNEEGLYFGTSVFPLPKVKLDTYVDFYKFPWFRFSQSEINKSGTDFLSQLSYSPSANTQLSIRYKTETKHESVSTDSLQIKGTEAFRTKKIRFKAQHSINQVWDLKHAVELVKFEKEFGYLIYQDIICRIQKPALTLTARYAVFETDSYDTRIYAYENDLLYTFSIPSFQGKGSRMYIMAKYSCKNIDLWIKYAASIYENQQSISSGLDEIDGNQKSEIKLQAIVKF